MAAVSDRQNLLYRLSRVAPEFVTCKDIQVTQDPCTDAFIIAWRGRNGAPFNHVISRHPHWMVDNCREFDAFELNEFKVKVKLSQCL